MKKKNLILAALSLFAMMAAGSVAEAAYTNTAPPKTMQVSLTNLASVTISTSPINFGNVLSTTTSKTATGSIAVNATSGLPYKVTISAGLHHQIPTITKTCRRMFNGTTAGRSYKLYKSVILSSVNTWGDHDFANTCGGSTFHTGGGSKSGTGSGVTQNLTVRAKAFGGTALGAMSDTLTVTVHY